jgi:hypothetical protein
MTLFTDFSRENTSMDAVNTAEVSKIDGELWYVRPSGRRERLGSYLRKNTKRMFVNGAYIPTSHPLHKPGRYKNFDDAWSHQKIEQTKEGEIYATGKPYTRKVNGNVVIIATPPRRANVLEQKEWERGYNAAYFNQLERVKRDEARRRSEEVHAG